MDECHDLPTPMQPHEYDWERTIELASQSFFGVAGLRHSALSTRKALQAAGIDRLLDKFKALNEEAGRWMIPKEHRPTCPLSGKPCPNWTCALDVCEVPDA